MPEPSQSTINICINGDKHDKENAASSQDHKTGSSKHLTYLRDFKNFTNIFCFTIQTASIPYNLHNLPETAFITMYISMIAEWIKQKMQSFYRHKNPFLRRKMSTKLSNWVRVKHNCKGWKHSGLLLHLPQSIHSADSNRQNIDCIDSGVQEVSIQRPDIPDRHKWDSRAITGTTASYFPLLLSQAMMQLFNCTATWVSK